MVDLALDLRNIRAVAIVAEQGSLRKAAFILGASQSAITRRIQILERRLGYSLLERDNRGSRLTAAGAEFLKAVGPSLIQFDRAIQLGAAVDRGDSGELRVGVLSSVPSGCLSDLFQTFREGSKGVKLILQEGTGEENLLRLTLGQLDVSLVAQDDGFEGYERIELWREKLVIVLPSGHALARQGSLQWEDVQRETFVIPRGGPGPNLVRHIRQRLRVPGVEPEIEYQDIGPLGVISLVRMGFGITLTCAAAVDLLSPGIEIRPLVGEVDTVTLGAVWSRNNPNRALRRLLNLMREKVQSCARTGAQAATRRLLVLFVTMDFCLNESWLFLAPWT